MLIGAFLAATPYLITAREGIYTEYLTEATRVWSASPINFIAPYHLHPLWGELIAQLRPERLWIEKTLYVGLIPGMLALVALHRFERRVVWLGTGLFAFILALGTDLHTGNTPLQPDNPIWLPAYYLHQLPVIGLMRVWARFGVVTILFVALLAGVGAAQLAYRCKVASSPQISSLSQRPHLLTSLIMLLVVLDLSPIQRENALLMLTPSPINTWLAQQPGDFIVGFEPVDATVNPYILYGTLIHRKRTFALMHDAHVPPTFQDFNERSRGFPDRISARRLRELGIRYLLLRKHMFDGKRAFSWDVVEQRLAEMPELQVVTEVDGVVVLEFR